MKITQESTSIHRQLSEISVRFLEFAAENPEIADRSQYRLLNWHDKRIKLQPWPTFVNHVTKEQLATASLKIADLIKTLPKRLFSNNPYQISHYYETSVDIVKIQLESTNDVHISQLLARSDFIISPTGLKCLEFNISSDLGGLENPIYANMYLNVPIIARFLNQYKVKINNSNLLLFLLQYLTGIAVNKWPFYQEFNIAFVIPGLAAGMDRKTEDVYLNQLYRGVLNSFQENLSGQIHLCDYQYLNVTDKGVFYNDKKNPYVNRIVWRKCAA